MRFENKSLLTVIVVVLLAGGAALILQFGGPVNLLVPILVVAILVGFVASITWFVGYLRTDRALARVRTEPVKRQPLWKYLLALTAALVAGVAYWGFPQYSRSIWYVYVALGIIAIVWLQVSRRRGG